MGAVVVGGRVPQHWCLDCEVIVMDLLSKLWVASCIHIVSLFTVKVAKHNLPLSLRGRDWEEERSGDARHNFHLPGWRIAMGVTVLAMVFFPASVFAAAGIEVTGNGIAVNNGSLHPQTNNYTFLGRTGVAQR